LSVDLANVSAEKMSESAGFVFHVFFELRRVTLSYLELLRVFGFEPGLLRDFYFFTLICPD